MHLLEESTRWTDSRHSKDFEVRNPGLSGRSGIVCHKGVDSRAAPAARLSHSQAKVREGAGKQLV